MYSALVVADAADDALKLSQLHYKSDNQSRCPLKQAGKVPGVYRGKNFQKRNVLSQERKSEGVMDGESGDDEAGEVI